MGCCPKARPSKNLAGVGLTNIEVARLSVDQRLFTLGAMTSSTLGCSANVHRSSIEFGEMLAKSGPNQAGVGRNCPKFDRIQPKIQEIVVGVGWKVV